MDGKGLMVLMRGWFRSFYRCLPLVRNNNISAELLNLENMAHGAQII